MNFFSISDIENLTNIKAHTLRVWEQRYGICVPKRKGSKHRYYDGEDLKEILRIAWLYHKGHRISRIASMDKEQIKNLALNHNQLGSNHEHYLNRLVEYSLDFDQPGFQQLLTDAILHLGFEKVMLDVVFPFLQKIGLFWITGHIIPAQEHFASNLIIQKILCEIDRLPVVEKATATRKVLVFSPKGESHEIPLLIMHYLLKREGAFVIYMGVNVLLDSIKTYCTAHQVDELYFHLVTNIMKSANESYFEQLSVLFPSKKIYCSGVGVHGVVDLPKNVQILRTNEALKKYPMST